MQCHAGCGQQWGAGPALKGSLSSSLTKTLDSCDFQRAWKSPQAAWPLPGAMLVSVLSCLLVHPAKEFGAAPCAGGDVGEPEDSQSCPQELGPGGRI